MPGPLENELNLACICRDLADGVRYELSLAGACWCHPGEQALALRHEANAREYIQRARILLDQIEQGLTK